MNLKEFRCSKCNKLLGKIDGRAEIVCTRCKKLNHYVDPAQDLFRKGWVKAKPVEDAENCYECDQLRTDAGSFHCVKYHDAIIEDVREKHCKDSIM